MLAHGPARLVMAESDWLYVRAEADLLVEASIGGANIAWAGLVGWVGKRMVGWVAFGRGLVAADLVALG